jgi:hypothetical protein
MEECIKEAMGNYIQEAKEYELKTMKDQFNTMQSQMQSLITTLGI